MKNESGRQESRETFGFHAEGSADAYRPKWIWVLSDGLESGVVTALICFRVRVVGRVVWARQEGLKSHSGV